MSSPANPTVRHYRFCGPITGAAHEAYVLLGTEDVSFELDLDTDYCIIVKVGNDGDMSAQGVFQLEVEVDGGGFNPVDDVSSNIRSTDSGDVDQAISTTERLGTSAETFINSVLDEVDGATRTNVGAGEEYEFYFAFNVRSAELSGGESLEFRLLTGGATFTHTVTLNATIAAGAQGPISASPAMVFGVPSADLKGKGKLDASPAVVFSASSADLQDASAVGPIDASPAMIFAVPAADLKGKGALDASPSMLFALASADLKAKGKLDASPAMIFAVPTADLKAKGQLDATANIVFALATADLKGIGTLDATPALVFAVPVADLVDSSLGPGPISASPALIFAAPTADLKGDGKLDAAPNIVFALASADLKALGILDATPDLVFAIPSADLINATAVGPISAAPTIVVAVPSANLGGGGKLDASPATAFTLASADLKGIGKLGMLMASIVFAVPSATMIDAGQVTRFHHIDITGAIRLIKITGKSAPLN